MNATKGQAARTGIAVSGQTRVSQDTGSPEPARPVFISLMEAESALAELEQRWQVLVGRLDGTLLTPAPPMGESKSEVSQPAGQVVLRLRDFTLRAANLADSIEHATARLEV